jgi:elongation factor Ts
MIHMAAVTAAMVKELRERTNAGMMDCKKALLAADGDMDKAIDWLREKGLAQAAKKASRVAAEGVVAQYVTPCGCTGVIVEVNCETDFVAKTDNFAAFANNVAKHIAKANPADVDELMNQKFVDDETKTISDLVSEATVAIGEKISVRRFARFQTEGVVATYIHMGGKVGVLVEVATSEEGKNNDAVKQFAHDLSLQIAAAKPEAVRREEVDSEKLEKEREIQRAKALEAGKPEKIVDRIVDGQIEKYYKEVCLLDQQFVKDPDKSIKGLMAEVSKAAGAPLDVVRFARFERGEGIEKRKDNLAAEIAAMQKA